MVHSSRKDLRTGLVAARVVDAPGGPAAVGAAVAALPLETSPARRAPLLVRIGLEALQDPAALDASLCAAGADPAGLGLEVAEKDCLGPDSLAALRRLKARGWALTLAADAACALPFGERTRALFCDISAPAEALASPRHTRLTERLAAARADGLILTALPGPSPAPAAYLLACGFDRADAGALEAGSSLRRLA